MKKLFVAAATVIMLTGCTQNADKKESKTCSIDMSGITMDIKMDATNEVVDNLGMNIKIPGSLLGGDASVLTEDNLKTMGNAALKQMNIEKGTGVETNFTIEGKDLNAEVTFDLKKADANTLKAIGITEEMKELKLTDAVKNFEAAGATCK